VSMNSGSQGHWKNMKYQDLHVMTANLSRYGCLSLHHLLQQFWESSAWERAAPGMHYHPKNSMNIPGEGRLHQYLSNMRHHVFNYLRIWSKSRLTFQAVG
jgi:hypothetical protein